MNTRILMIASSVFVGTIGLLLSLMPQESARALEAGATGVVPLLLQLAGASLIGWALLNWTARGLVIGGIYARPLTLGNLLHFLAAGLALGKAAAASPFPGVLLIALLGYGAFAACFAWLAFGQGAACVPATGRAP